MTEEQLTEIILRVVDQAKIKLAEKQAKELARRISENIKHFEEMKKSGQWTGKEL